MACEQTAFNVTFGFHMAITFAINVVESERALSASLIFSPQLVGYYLGILPGLRDARNQAVGTLSGALNSHAACWGPIAPRCLDEVTAIRNRVDELQNNTQLSAQEILTALEHDYEYFKTTGCGVPVVVDLGSPDDVETAENVDLELHFRGRWLGQPRQYTVPALQHARDHKVRHPLRPKPGGGGPTIWIECTVFDIETWKVGANAEVLGTAVTTEAPFTFEWTFDGAPVTQGAVVEPASSSVELLVPPHSQARRLALKSTSKSGIVLEHGVSLRTPATREDCSPPAVPFFLPGSSLVRTKR